MRSNLTLESFLLGVTKYLTVKFHRPLTYLLEEEVISQVIQHHWITGINRVSPREELDAILDGISLNETFKGISSISIALSY